MTMRSSIYSMFIAAVIACLASCSKDKHIDATGDWLFPIAKGELSIGSLGKLKNLKYTVEIAPVDLGVPTGVVVASPGLNIDHVGPFAVQITSWLRSITLDSIDINANLDNVFPIPIGKGTVISIRNTNDGTSTTNIVGSTTITKDIQPNENFNVDFKAANKTLGDSVFFFLDHFTSPPYAGVTFTQKPTTLVVTLKVIEASFVELYTGKQFASIDTAEFKAGDSDNLGTGSGGVVSDTSVTGSLSVYLDNSLPTHLAFQTYFLDENKTRVIDSLFSNQLVINGVSTDAAGTPATTNSTVTKVSITRKRIDNIKRAKYVVTKIDFNTNGYSTPWVAANKRSKLNIQITGDLNIKITF